MSPTRRKSQKVPLRLNHDLPLAVHLRVKHAFTQKFIHEYDLVRFKRF